MSSTRIFPIPPIVAQRSTVGPTGEVDSAGSTDCGEACLSSAILAVRGIRIAPGCLRQALSLPPDNGSTTGAQLAVLWEGVGRKAAVRDLGVDILAGRDATLRRAEKYAVILGTWILPDLQHWMLAYHRQRGTWRVMDPWRGALVELSPGDFRDNYSGTIVELS